MRRAALAALCAIAVASTVSPTPAVEPVLTSDAVAMAVAAGRAMAQRHEGYTIAPYLLFGLDDALTIIDDNATIEAVQVGTPYERVRYEAFVRTEQRAAFGTSPIAQFMQASNGHLDMIVYVHSRSETDRNFMQAYVAGTLERADGTHVAPLTILRTTPIEDGYLRPNHVRTTRWLGQVTYRFDATAAIQPPAVTAFSLTDDRSTLHRYPMVLAHYR